MYSSLSETNKELFNKNSKLNHCKVIHSLSDDKESENDIIDNGKYLDNFEINNTQYLSSDYNNKKM